MKKIDNITVLRTSSLFATTEFYPPPKVAKVAPIILETAHFKMYEMLYEYAGFGKVGPTSEFVVPINIEILLATFDDELVHNWIIKNLCDGREHLNPEPIPITLENLKDMYFDAFLTLDGTKIEGNPFPPLDNNDGVQFYKKTLKNLMETLKPIIQNKKLEEWNLEYHYSRS